VRGMTKTAALELARDNIRVNSIHPGYIRTPMSEESQRPAGTRFGGVVPRHPAPRIADPVAQIGVLVPLGAGTGRGRDRRRRLYSD